MRIIVSSIEGEYRRYKRLGEGAFAQLNDELLCQVGPSGGLSVATIAWHISGNLASRFADFLTTDGEKPWRNRESEFEGRRVNSGELLAKWEVGWKALLAALEGLSDADLSRIVTIRGQEHSVLEALHRSLAHTSYHVGQIVYVGKSLRGSDWQSLSIPPGQSDAYNNWVSAFIASMVDCSSLMLWRSSGCDVKYMSRM